MKIVRAGSSSTTAVTLGRTRSIQGVCHSVGSANDFKFTLNGERLHGSFVLVRMAHDRERGKRTN